VTIRGTRNLILAVLGAAIVGCASVGPSPSTSEVFERAPWPASERIEYRLVDDLGVEVGQGVLSVTSEREAITLHQAYIEAAPPSGAAPTTDEITLRVEAGTLRPMQGERVTVRRDSQGEMVEQQTQWSYSEEANPRLLADREIRLREHYYDNESSLWLWRGLGFTEGYEDSYVSVNAFEGSQQTVNLRVPQIETVEVPAGTFETWRLLVRTGRAVRTAWIEVAQPHRVVRWDNGELIFEMTGYEAN
jgi:hypothetical protein